MTRLFCMALMLLGLGGCGEANNGTTVPDQVPGTETTVPTVKDGSDTSVPGPIVETNIPVPNALVANGSCGEIVLRGNPARPMNESVLRQAGNCLAQAFQACSPTVLTIRDETNNLARQFSVSREGTDCTLRQALQTDPNSPPAVVDCQRVRAYTTALVVEGCSHLGDYTLAP